MTRLVLRPYKPEDFTSIKLDPRVVLGRTGQPIEAWALSHKLAGPCATFIDPEGEIVACGGIHDKWDGLGEVWGVFSPLASKYLHTFRAVVGAIEFACSYFRYTRLQCAVDPTWGAAVRFIERLGFHRECIMKRYGPNDIDYALYAYLKGVGKNG